MTEPVVTRAHREIAASDLRDGGLSHWEAEALQKWVEDGANPCWGEGSMREGEPVGIPDWYRSESTLADFAQLIATIEHKGRREAEPKWILASAELPDSDVRVLVRCTDGDIVSAELGFTDDSEGHGEPYWAAGDCGDLSFCNYPHWMPRPADPPSGGASAGRRRRNVTAKPMPRNCRKCRVQFRGTRTLCPKCFEEENPR